MLVGGVEEELDVVGVHELWIVLVWCRVEQPSPELRRFARAVDKDHQGGDTGRSHRRERLPELRWGCILRG